jgi:uncharacterized protein YbjQ (UPF0145 family)
MSDDDDDFTRVEDLESYLHEEQTQLSEVDEDDITSLQDDILNNNDELIESDPSSLDEIPNLAMQANEENQHPTLPMEDVDLQTGQYSLHDFKLEETEDSSPQEQNEGQSLTEFNLSLEDLPEEQLEDLPEQETHQPPLPPADDETQTTDDQLKTADEFNDIAIDTEQEHAPALSHTEEAQKQEDFQELKNFGQNFTHSPNSTQGPHYSLVIDHIPQEKIEQVNKIIDDIEGLTEELKGTIKSTTMHSRLLVSHLSEFAIISIANKLKRTGLALRYGLAHEIQSSNQYEDKQLGQYHAQSLTQNKTTIFQANHIGDVITTTSSVLKNYEIIEYKGVISSIRTVGRNKLNSSLSQKDLDSNKDNEVNHQLNQSLSELKLQARRLECNAITSVTLSTSPLQYDETRVQIICMGTATKVKKIK